MTRNDTPEKRFDRRDYLKTAGGTIAATGLATVPALAGAREKAELIDSIASEADITKADGKKALDAFIDTTTKALKKGNRVALVGFGTLRQARRSRSPRRKSSSSNRVQNCPRK